MIEGGAPPDYGTPVVLEEDGKLVPVRVDIYVGHVVTNNNLILHVMRKGHPDQRIVLTDIAAKVAKEALRLA